MYSHKWLVISFLDYHCDLFQCLNRPSSQTFVSVVLDCLQEFTSWKRKRGFLRIPWKHLHSLSPQHLRLFISHQLLSLKYPHISITVTLSLWDCWTSLGWVITLPLKRLVAQSSKERRWGDIKPTSSQLFWENRDSAKGLQINILFDMINTLLISREIRHQV